MNDGKPTDRKPKWWSRPASTPLPAPQPVAYEAADPAAGEGDFTLAAPAAPQAAGTAAAAAPAPAQDPSAPADPPQAAGTTDIGVTGVADAAETAELPVTPSVPQQARPLHEPDEYRTPPYGGPGPWAPAAPHQPHAPAPQAAPRQQPQPLPHGPAPHAPLPAPQQTPAPWVQYDPWTSHGAPLSAVVEPPAKPRRRRGLALAGVLAFALVTGVLGGVIGSYVERNGGLTTIELPQAGSGDTARAPESVAGIAASALPSVVTIHVSGGGSSGTGTGFVLDTRGHILTNNHVVDAASSAGDISVTFSSGETASAKLIGKDTGYDLAVVQVTGVSNLKPLPLGNSDDVRVGDPVVAIGAPFDLQNTVTSGIISAKERPITAGGEKGDGSDVSYVDALQTDAPINPGNSGGPLVDSKARVIGINSAIRAADNGTGGEGGQAGSIGLGFAIPINQGKRVAEELINTGKATHPVIGVSLDMQFSGDGARVGDKGKDGSASITPGGPAAKAGIRPGDVITKVDGQRVHNGEELIVKIRAHRPGDKLELTVVRAGKEQTKTLTLGSSQGT
ncbi:PDZ domain-containing protein [Streptomyces sp. ms191]|uniref:S1C family serine protease n=1 Tax=Streptomyces sp. ms191 TaxID=1827978 RepID=UPI0011CDA00C|nr:trypsin-like peptidase domain-containing protein [Streptomyces sp. ms191]TXS20940.1 PDZ domain-containing protein [Streptomyces sp. ms191]